jgi:uncharacterized membrane protein
MPVMSASVATATNATNVGGATSPDQRPYRLTAIDSLRGLVIVIMAIDHVRDFFIAGAQQDPMVDPNVTVSMFATRWITHFCAPVFVLLAGVSAGLMTSRRNPRDLARLLATRGLWLVFVEWFVISTLSTFSPGGISEVGGQIVVPMQVIWAIGVSMIVLSGVQLLGRRACFAIGLAIVAGHNLLDPFWPRTQLLEQNWPAWAALHSQMALSLGPFLFVFIYPVVAWIGVMLLGFGVSGVFERPAAQRNAALLKAGIAVTGAFILLRAIDLYGDPNPWQWQARGLVATAMDFLNTTKYPPSFAFLLMTLGPAAVMCAGADRMNNPLTNGLITFGRVPFAFYIAHVALIHTLSVLLGLAQGFSLGQMMTIFLFYPSGYGVSLAGVYVVWALVIAMLYPFCRWMVSVKARRRDWWLSYL